MCIIILFLKATQPSKNGTISIPCNKGSLIYSLHNNQTILIDPGYLGQRISSSSWVEFTLLPYLQKTFGHAHIDHLVVMQPSIMTFQATARLIQLTQIKNIYIPYWSGTAQKQFLQAYGILYHACKEHQTNIIRFKNSYTLAVSDKLLKISSLNNDIKYQEITFPAYCISGICETNSAKYNPK